MAADLQVARAARVSRAAPGRATPRAHRRRATRYLVKNGSERVIDDARSHLSMCFPAFACHRSVLTPRVLPGLIKVLRNFHYTDDGGKDQGINGERVRCCATRGVLMRDLYSPGPLEGARRAAL